MSLHHDHFELLIAFFRINIIQRLCYCFLLEMNSIHSTIRSALFEKLSTKINQTHSDMLFTKLLARVKVYDIFFTMISGDESRNRFQRMLREND